MTHSRRVRLRPATLLVLALAAAPVSGRVYAQMPGAFRQRCSVCHQPSGAGIPGVYPPLAATVGNYVRIPEGRNYLVHVLVFGMNGPIVSDGTSYNGYMPSASDFSDEDLAAAINYVLVKLNARLVSRDFKPIAAAEFQAARGAQLSPADVLREREKLLSGLEKTAHAGGER